MQFITVYRHLMYSFCHISVLYLSISSVTMVMRKTIIQSELAKGVGHPSKTTERRNTHRVENDACKVALAVVLGIAFLFPVLNAEFIHETGILKLLKVNIVYICGKYGLFYYCLIVNAKRD